MNRRLFLVMSALALAGCNEKAAVTSVEPFHIAEVQVAGPVPEGGTAWQLQDLKDWTTQYASYVPQTANPKLLRLRIDRFHKKNAALSLIVGDANAMAVTGEVASPDGSTTLGTFTVNVSQSGEINGIIGAAMAATANEDKTIQKLDQMAADAILEKIYGTKVWKGWLQRGR